MERAIDVVQVKAEIAVEKLAVIIENGSVLLKDMQSGEAVKIATLTPPNAVPPCYQPDGDGCAYQCYDGDDEPINKCKECPLCYSDKKRRKPSNEALTIEQLREMVGEPGWVQTPGIPQYGRWVIVAGVDTEYGQSTLYCQGDYTCRNYGRDWIAYRRPPEGEEET